MRLMSVLTLTKAHSSETTPPGHPLLRLIGFMFHVFHSLCPHASHLLI
jgi:hypothetical protein